MAPITDPKLRVALVGCGAISKKHVAAIGRCEDAEIVGAYDLVPELAEAFGKEHGIPSYTDADQLVSATDPHVLDVLTPSGTHGDVILELLRFDRHFVVEKPLALRLDQIDSILEQCDRRGLRVFVVKQNRFNPPIVKLAQAIRTGRFGKLVLGTVRVRWSRNQGYYDKKSWRGTWAMDGGVLTNQASHHIDMLQWLMGDADSVVAKTSTRLVSIEAEDTGVAIIRFRNGGLGIIEATTATRPMDLEGSVSILGEHGAVEIGGFFMNELETWQFANETPEDEEIRTRHASVPREFAWNHTEYFRDVFRSLREDSPGLVEGREGHKSVELIHAIYESAESGREVSLPFTGNESRLGRNPRIVS